MKKSFLILSLLLFTFTSCAVMLSPTQQYQLSDSQKSMAYTINQYGQKTGAFYWCGGKNSLYEAKRCAINNCIKFYGKQGYCITGLENNNDVFNKRVSDYLKQQQRNSIAAKKNLCKSYGFKSENAIASCVQREIERERLAIAQRNANIARQNAQRQENINRALSEAAKTIQNIGTPNSNVSVCNFKCVSSGVIVAGDCSRGAVYIGSETCFKTN